MKQENLLKCSQEQLARILSFFPRAETKAAIILGLDTAILALLVPKFRAFLCFQLWMLTLLVPIILIGLSIFFLYRSSSPQLNGGHNSLIYFKEIAKMNKEVYVQKFSKQSLAEHTNDLISQIWRNSEILSAKFKYLKYSYFLLLSSILPACIALIIFAYE